MKLIVSHSAIFIVWGGWRKMKQSDEYDLEWTLPYTDNYTGPNWSNGKWQASVANGDKKPKSLLDSYSRDHDTSYATCSDDQCLDNADRLYYERSRDMSFVPRIIGSLPIAVNPIVRRTYRFFSGEKYSKMASQALVGNLRGHNDLHVARENPVLRAVGGQFTTGNSVCYEPTLTNDNKTSNLRSEKPKPTPLVSSKVKEVPLDLPQFGGDPRGINRPNFFLDHRGNRRGGFLSRWRRNNKNKINKVYLASGVYLH